MRSPGLAFSPLNGPHSCLICETWDCPLFFGWSKPTLKQVFSVGMSGFTGIYLFPNFSRLGGQLSQLFSFLRSTHWLILKGNNKKNEEHVTYLNLLLLHRKRTFSPKNRRAHEELRLGKKKKKRKSLSVSLPSSKDFH